MATGDAQDIVHRVRQLIPGRWFMWGAPLRDAVLGGLADSMAWLYQWLIFIRQQSRIATASGIFLDLIAYDFLNRTLLRGAGGTTDDTNIRIQITNAILAERVTRKGMMNALTLLLTVPPFIFEPWNPFDAGGYGEGNFAYGRAGGWGSIQLPGQVFLKVSRAALRSTGVPYVQGWGGTPTLGGYGVGAIQYIATETPEIGVTDQDIYNTIVRNKPTGLIVWTQIGTEVLLGAQPALLASIGPPTPLFQALETNPHWLGKFIPTMLNPRRHLNRSP